MCDMNDELRKIVTGLIGRKIGILRLQVKAAKMTEAYAESIWIDRTERLNVQEFLRYQSLVLEVHKRFRYWCEKEQSLAEEDLDLYREVGRVIVESFAVSIDADFPSF